MQKEGTYSKNEKLANYIINSIDYLNRQKAEIRFEITNIEYGENYLIKDIVIKIRNTETETTQFRKFVNFQKKYNTELKNNIDQYCLGILDFISVG